ncbi:MAG: peptidylprolyl isomerase [Candidatus Polarisedimenticolaceae bacterium]|nr:peptidylprolyl isomerase [Candidatus Polarisedimenticolaceae bacterium]
MRNIPHSLLWLLPSLVFVLTACNNQQTLVKGSGEIVAKVNGAPVFESQMAVELEQQLQKHNNPSTEIVNIVRQRILEKVIGQEVLFQASHALDIPDIAEKTEEALQTVKNGLGSEERLQGYLKAYNLTEKQLRSTARRKIYIEEYLDSKGLMSPDIPEGEVRSFYDKRPFKNQEGVRVKHILLAVAEDVEPAEKEVIRQKAGELRRLIAKGEDFSTLAKEHSDSAEAQETGGDLGYLRRDYMPPEFDAVAYSLKEGEVSDVFETKFGFHIVKLMDKRPAGIVPFNEVSDFIKRYLQNERRPQLIAAHVEDLRAKADVEIIIEN